MLLKQNLSERRLSVLLFNLLLQGDVFIAGCRRVKKRLGNILPRKLKKFTVSSLFLNEETDEPTDYQTNQLMFICKLIISIIDLLYLSNKKIFTKCSIYTYYFLLYRENIKRKVNQVLKKF